jgi:hypothetical protein
VWQVAGIVFTTFEHFPRQTPPSQAAAPVEAPQQSAFDLHSVFCGWHAAHVPDEPHTSPVQQSAAAAQV